MQPVVQALAEKYGTKIRFIVADINTEKGNILANEYQIMYIPALFFIDKQGKVVDSSVGAMTKADLEQRLKKIIE